MDQYIEYCFHCKDTDLLMDCYFCQVPHPYCLMEKKHKIITCKSYPCSSILGKEPLEKNTCDVCSEVVDLNTLPCKHKLCLQCCKHNYLGFTFAYKPKHCNEIEDLSVWPYTEKEFDEHCKFEDEHSDELLVDTFEEYVDARDKLKSSRPDYMNTEEMIEYENEQFKYELEWKLVNDIWKQWESLKTPGSDSCPFCRSTLK